ncbi:MAG: hypothetical protein ACFB51_18740 [Anaerolineae bacterium]
MASGNGSLRTAGMVLIGLGVAFLLSMLIPGFGQFIWAAAFLGAAFFVYSIYSRDHSKWGGLLGAYSLAVPGVLLLLGMLPFDGLVVAGFIASFGLPFLYAYTIRRDQWAWLIPAAMFLLPASAVLLGVIWAAIPVVLIVAGVYLLVRASGKREEETPAAAAPVQSNGHRKTEQEKKNPVVESRPISGPEADFGA